MPTTAQGGTFSFKGVVADIVSLSVETPTAEVVDMTAWNHPAQNTLLVPTGSWSGGAVDVDFLYRKGGTDPQTVVRQVGPLVFSSAGYSVTRQAILEQATVEASAGDIVRGTLRFRMTDYFE